MHYIGRACEEFHLRKNKKVLQIFQVLTLAVYNIYFPKLLRCESYNDFDFK